MSGTVNGFLIPKINRKIHAPNSINGREALLFNIQDFCVNTHYDPYKKLIMNEILMKYG